jgi:hypothetical protein
MVDAPVLNQLLQFPSLKKVYLWNTAVSGIQAAEFSKTAKKISFETSDFVDTVMLKLPPPMIQHKQFVISEPVNLNLKHNINGAQIRYTIDGSEPDSIHSRLFIDNVLIERDIVIKTKVFREGWISSDVLTARFYVGKLKPEKIYLLNQPYQKGGGGLTLFDGEFAGTNNIAGKWLGYFKPGLDVLFDFGKKVHLNTVTLSFVIDNYHEALGPGSIILWYGNDSNHLKKLPVMKPKPPDEKQPDGNISYAFKLPAAELQYVRIQAEAVERLPSWVNKLRTPGWIYVDEIILN